MSALCCFFILLRFVEKLSHYWLRRCREGQRRTRFFENLLRYSGRDLRAGAGEARSCGRDFQHRDSGIVRHERRRLRVRVVCAVEDDLIRRVEGADGAGAGLVGSSDGSGRAGETGANELGCRRREIHGSSIDGTTARVVGLPLIEAVKSKTPEKTKPAGLMVTVPVVVV